MKLTSPHYIVVSAFALVLLVGFAVHAANQNPTAWRAHASDRAGAAEETASWQPAGIQDGTKQVGLEQAAWASAGSSHSSSIRIADLNADMAQPKDLVPPLHVERLPAVPEGNGVTRQPTAYSRHAVSRLPEVGANLPVTRGESGVVEAAQPVPRRALPRPEIGRDLSLVDLLEPHTPAVEPVATVSYDSIDSYDGSSGSSSAVVKLSDLLPATSSGPGEISEGREVGQEAEAMAASPADEVVARGSTSIVAPDPFRLAAPEEPSTGSDVSGLSESDSDPRASVAVSPIFVVPAGDSASGDDDGSVVDAVDGDGGWRPVANESSVAEVNSEPNEALIESAEALQVQESPSDRGVRRVASVSPLVNLASAARESAPITFQEDEAPDDSFGLQPLMMDDEEALSLDSMQGASDLMEEELFQDPFNSGLPCQIGCQRKYYAMADFVAYQPEVGTFRVSNAVSTDQANFREGARLTFGYRGDCLKGWEMTLLELSNVSDVASATGPAGTLSTRWNPPAGISTVGLTGPGVTGHSQAQRMEFSSFEFARTTWGWDVMNTQFGLRLFRYDESVSLSGFSAGAETARFDQALENFLIGPQVGITLIDDSRYSFTYDFKAKLGAYGNVINGNTRFIDQGVTQISNTSSRDVGFAFNGEVSTGLAWQLTPSLKFRAGFDLLYIYGIASTRAQLVTVPGTDTLQLNAATGGSLDNDDDVLFWGGTIGLYGNWP